MPNESQSRKKNIFERARSRVYIALDNMPYVDGAINLGKELSGFIGGVKVGKELHVMSCNEGRKIFEEFYELGIPVFADLKLHDTPNTVYRSAIGLSVPGVSMFNVHIAGGEKMCKKAIEGAQLKHSISPRERVPEVIGVTVLTSLDDSDLETQGLGIKYDDLVRKGTELALEWGLDGIVCPANKAGMLEKEFGSGLKYVTPGIEWAGLQGNGQKQLYTPGLAVRDCSNSILVVGSAITTAENRKKAAEEIIQDMEKYLCQDC